MIHICVKNRQLIAVTDEPLVAKTVGVVHFEAEFDENWEGFTKTVVFKNGNAPGVPVVYLGGPVEVPAQALDRSGRLYISAVGRDKGRREVTARWVGALYVERNGDLGENPVEPDPPASELEQAMIACARYALDSKEAADRAQAAAANPPKISESGTWLVYDADTGAYVDTGIPCGGGSGGVGGLPGKDGGYYKPEISQHEEGTMRVGFTPSREDMPAVTDVKVKLPTGPRGEAGKTPVKGEDYWTTEDKQEIVDDVLAEVPEGDGIDVSGASVGQTIKIAAVDDKGVPTAWEPVEFPSGGVGEWRFINRITATEDVRRIEISEDSEGKPFELTDFCMFFYGNNSETTMTVGGGYINKMNVLETSINFPARDSSFLNKHSAIWNSGSAVLGGSGLGSARSQMSPKSEAEKTGHLFEKITSLGVGLPGASQKMQAGATLEAWGR